MLSTIKRSFGVILGIVQNAHRRPQTGGTDQARVISEEQIRRLEHLEWIAESVYWESLRLERQLVIEMAELERENARLNAEIQRQEAESLRRTRSEWSRRMHAAKAAKHAANKA